MNLASAKVVTAVTAVLLPPTCLKKNNDMSRREFCNLFSINRKAKYFQSALENRQQYESFLQAKG